MSSPPLLLGQLLLLSLLWPKMTQMTSPTFRPFCLHTHLLSSQGQALPYLSQNHPQPLHPLVPLQSSLLNFIQPDAQACSLCPGHLLTRTVPRASLPKGVVGPRGCKTEDGGAHHQSFPMGQVWAPLQLQELESHPKGQQRAL